MLVADRTETAKERGGRRNVPALAEDGLDEDRADGAGDTTDDNSVWRLASAAGRRGLLIAIEVLVGHRERREVDAGQQRLVTGPVVEVRRRDARRAHRPAVEAATEGHDARAAGDPTGELERAIDRLGARVHEHHRVERLGERRREIDREARDRFGETDRVDRSDQPVHLLVDRRSDARMDVTERGDGDPVREVEVRLAVRVVQPVPTPWLHERWK